MVAEVAIITAIYDGYDSLKPVQTQTIDVEWVCVTGDEALGRGDVDPLGWQITYEPRPGVHPNRAAKNPKMLPEDYTDVPRSIWLDASFQVVSPTLAVDMLGYATPWAPVAQFGHPWRDCLYDEAKVSAEMPKYVGEPLAAQVDHYGRMGMPHNWGLWATGVIARQHTPDVLRWGSAWLAEVGLWSFQDQVSHPYACWTRGITPVNLPGTHLGNAWLSYQGSGRH